MEGRIDSKPFDDSASKIKNLESKIASSASIAPSASKIKNSKSKIAREARYLVIGAGFSGAVLARELVEKSACSVLVLEERGQLGGNCHTERDAATGVMVHRFGPHIFNTDNERVWSYVNRHGDFRPFVNRVKAHTARGMFSMPINLLTINQFFGKTMNPDEARSFIAALGDKTITEPGNFEEQALKMVGRDLYETFFKGYSIKQWGCDPKELPAGILKRLPIRFNYDDNYYDKRFQGIPAEGYTEVIRKILDHPRIEVRLNEKFDSSAFYPESALPPSSPISAFQSFSFSAFSPFSHLFSTGPIDAFFGYSEGRLGYRSVTFERIQTDAADFQGNAVINYPGMEVPFTRIHEHKHFTPWESHDKTVAFREFSQETGPADIPYYPKRLKADKALLQKYRALAESLHPTSKIQHQKSNIQHHPSPPPSSFIQNPTSNIQNYPPPGVSFLGRLATYRYMDMETVIGEALDFSDRFIQAMETENPLPVFPNVAATARA